MLRSDVATSGTVGCPMQSGTDHTAMDCVSVYPAFASIMERYGTRSYMHAVNNTYLFPYIDVRTDKRGNYIIRRRRNII